MARIGRFLRPALLSMANKHNTSDGVREIHAWFYECESADISTIWTIDNPVGRDSTDSTEDVYLIFVD